MMTQTLLPFQYQIEKSESGLTAFAGLPLYVELAVVSGLCKKINQLLKTKQQGWTDLQIILSLLLLNLTGGDCVDDIERLESDEGLRTLFVKLETHGMKRKDRRLYERRFRKSKQRTFPSTSVIHRYLEQFHHPGQETLRTEGKAFIPLPNELLHSLRQINPELLNFAQQKNPVKMATLDQDATLSETSKRSARFCYQSFKAYQPFNTYWHEQGLLVHSEFRDGNVNAGFEPLRLFKSALAALPKGIEKAYLRSDSAGYQVDLLKYCAEGKNDRFGVIEFAVGINTSNGFKVLNYHRLDQR